MKRENEFDEGQYALTNALQDIIEDDSLFPWKNCGILDCVTLSSLPETVGLYRFSHEGEVVYVGSATDIKGVQRGIRGRLKDYLTNNRVQVVLYKLRKELTVEIREIGSSEYAVLLSLIIEMYEIYVRSPKYNRRGIKVSDSEWYKTFTKMQVLLEDCVARTVCAGKDPDHVKKEARV